MTRYVFVSTSAQKNWIFVCKQRANKFWNILNKEIGMMEASVPLALFSLHRVIDRDDNGVIIRDEVRESK